MKLKRGRTGLMRWSHRLSVSHQEKRFDIVAMKKSKKEYFEIMKVKLKRGRTRLMRWSHRLLAEKRFNAVG